MTRHIARRQSFRAIADAVPAPAGMTEAHASAVRDRCCSTKPRYRYQVAAGIADKINQTRGIVKRPYAAYRCPFSGAQAHWHVGRVITVNGMTELAEAMRTLRRSA